MLVVFDSYDPESTGEMLSIFKVKIVILIKANQGQSVLRKSLFNRLGK